MAIALPTRPGRREACIHRPPAHAAIATARGFDPFAKTWAVLVTRLNGKTIRVDCDKPKNDARYDLPVYPGDIIFVERRII